MRFILLFFLIQVGLCLTTPISVPAQEPEEIGDLRIVDGLYDVGLMTWYSPCLFPGVFLARLDLGEDVLYIKGEDSRLVLIGEVVTIGLPTRQSSEDSTYTRGRLQVNRILHCPRQYSKQVAEIRVIESDGFEGLQLGDRLILFMVPYEGEYAIPTWSCLNSRIGVRLPGPGSSEYFDEPAFIKMIENKLYLPADSLSADELRLWAKVDPCGVAEALIQWRDLLEDNQ